MKAIVLEEKVRLEYFLGYYNRLYYGAFEECHLEVGSSSDKSGWVTHKEVHLNWEKCHETNEYAREFSRGEILSIGGDNYKIILVSHDENGTIIYRIDKRNVVEDEESKFKAESDLVARKLVLEERKKVKEDEKLRKLEEVDYALKFRDPNKKWYQFWKE